MAQLNPKYADLSPLDARKLALKLSHEHYDLTVYADLHRRIILGLSIFLLFANYPAFAQVRRHYSLDRFGDYPPFIFGVIQVALFAGIVNYFLGIPERRQRRRQARENVEFWDNVNITEA